MHKCKDAKESSVLILEEKDYICYHSAITSVEKKKQTVMSSHLLCVTEPKLWANFIFVQYSFYNFLQN